MTGLLRQQNRWSNDVLEEGSLAVNYGHLRADSCHNVLRV